MVDGVEIEMSLKGSLDHKDFDFKFVMNQMKNDEKVTKEIENLREAKKELREFEENID